MSLADLIVALQRDGWMGVHGSTWVSVLVMVFWALLLAVVVLAVVRLLLVPVVEGLDTTPGPDDRALAVLRERYARGDIDEEEFERRRRFLRERD